MFCTKCGMKNDDDALFCAGCGSVMSRPQELQPQVNTDEPRPQVNPQEPQQQVNTQEFQQVNTQEPQGVSLEKVQTEEVASEEAENTVNEPVNDVQVESVEPQTFDVPQSQEGAVNFSQPQNTEQPQSFSQPQNTEQPQSFNQPFNYNQSQNYGQSQNQNYGQPYNYAQQQNYGQSQFGGQQYANPQPVRNGNFSVKRFIFSALIVIASIFACACIAFDYVGLKMSSNIDGEKDSDTEYSKGYNIIKDEMEGLDDFTQESEAKKLVDTANLFRVFVIIFEVALVVFTIIDLILLLAVRKRGAYVFTMIFSLVKMGIGGFAAYLWCFKVLDQLKVLFESLVSDFIGYSDFVFNFSSMLGIGFILALVMQAVIFVCSIILLTCKNRQRVQTQA